MGDRKLFLLEVFDPKTYSRNKGAYDERTIIYRRKSIYLYTRKEKIPSLMYMNEKAKKGHAKFPYPKKR